MIQTPVVVVGMGKSGESAKRLLMHLNLKQDEVFTFDQKLPADFSDPQELMAKVQPKTLVVSPGFPLKTPWLQVAKSSGVTITSEINLACAHLKDEKIIGVTGSLGKSTTVSLLGAGLEAFHPEGFVGGNLGTPFCDYAFEVLSNKRPRAKWVVLELSSYQLENSASLKLEHSAITYLSANHLERYDSLEHYYQTKWSILKATKGFLFLNSHGGDLVEYAKKQADFKRCRVVSKEDLNLQRFDLGQSQLLGKHNQDNLALAASIALHCEWPLSAIDGMKNFSGLEHRIENVGIFAGVRYINDSKATAIDSVLTAAEVAHSYLLPGGTLHLLLGGKDKNLPWEELKTLSHFSNTKFLFFGACRELAQSKSQLNGPSYDSLAKALEQAMNVAKKNDIVLLSPGGTSYDEFKGFEDRGRFFKETVKAYFSNKN